MTDTLCILPWVSIETGPLGEIRPCCLARDPVTDDAGIPMHLSKHTLSEAYNSNYMKDLRQQFLDGKKPKSCDRCWDEEAAGRTSKRLNSKNRLKNLLEGIDFTDNVSNNLIFLDLKLGNICNLKCRICGSYSSSKWAQEEIDIYPENKSAKSNLIAGRWPRESKEFWEDLTTLLPLIRYMEFTGGEPFLIDEHFDLLQQAVDLGVADQIEIHYNTNTTQVPKRGFKIWPHFKSVEIALSIDDVGERFEYQRYGASWDTLKFNLDKFYNLIANTGNITLQVCLTVNVLNVYYLDEVAEWISYQNFQYVYFNVLHDAWYFSVRNLNSDAKKMINDKFKDYQGPYKNDIVKVIEFMNQGEGSDCTMLVEVLTNSDTQRNQSLSNHHPEIAKAIGYE
jgi:MoaA/NifB/PqqE/SkfB family radical SAM enzyme